jgi:hypothetical protein
VTKITLKNDSVRILLESQEDIWFWERRFNVFDFLELFPPGAITEAVPDTHVPPPASIQLTFETDAGCSFQTDIVRGGFYLRNQTQGTRKWTALSTLKPGDSIEISRIESASFRLSRIAG